MIDPIEISALTSKYDKKKKPSNFWQFNVRAGEDVFLLLFQYKLLYVFLPSFI